MSIDPFDGKAYLCNLGTTMHSAGFGGRTSARHAGGRHHEDHAPPQGRIRGFTGLIPGALYYPSADTPGGIVPERGTAGPVISAIAATAGSAFLRNVHIRAGHRPLAGVWTIAFPTATTCRITPPGGSAGASFTVAADTAYNGTITGAEDFYIETRTLTGGDTATITVSYTTAASVVAALDSPGNAFTAIAPLGGAAGRIVAKGLYTLVTTATTVTAGFNGGAQSAAKAIAAGGVISTLFRIALTTQGSS